MIIYFDHGSEDFWLICWCGDNALNEQRELLFYYNYGQYK
jgi:hypothetical protein